MTFWLVDAVLAVVGGVLWFWPLWHLRRNEAATKSRDRLTCDMVLCEQPAVIYDSIVDRWFCAVHWRLWSDTIRDLRDLPSMDFYDQDIDE